MSAAAGPEFGILSRGELLALGVAGSAIDSWVERGLLHVVHVGVYAVGHRYLSEEGRWLAAVKACGTGSALSHVSCAKFRRWLEFDDAHAVHVTISDRSGRSRPGITVHRPRTLVPDRDIEEIGPLRVTSARRTLIDLAGRVSLRTLASAVRQAEKVGDLSRAELCDIAATVRPRKGVRNLKLAVGFTVTRTKSGYERRFLRLCERIDAPRVLTNAFIAGAERDFFFPTLNLIVEIDPWPTHDLAANLQSDPQRDIVALIGGIPTVRFTGSRLDFDLRGVERDMRALIARLSRGGPNCLSR